MTASFNERINSLNTTNFRITVSVMLTAFAVVVCFIGVTLLHWEPTEKQITVLEGIALTLLTMMGFDVIQFIGKRQTDAGLAAAKNPNQPVLTNVPPETRSAIDQPIPTAAMTMQSSTTAKGSDPLAPIGESVAGEGD